MTEGFSNWEAVERNLLVLPITNAHGVTHEYTIEPLGYLDEERIRRSQTAARQAIDLGREIDEEVEPEVITDEEFLVMVLGKALAKMRADNVARVAITHAAAVAHTDATMGRESALFVWQNGLNPQRLADDLERIRTVIANAETVGAPANRAERRAAAKAGRPVPHKTPSPGEAVEAASA